MVLTPEMVRTLCRNIGGSTNSQAADVEDACQRIIDGADFDKVMSDIREENEQWLVDMEANREL